MNILLTGGLGYIGSHISIQLLKLDHNVIIIDNLSNSNISVLDRIQQITNKTISFYQHHITISSLNTIFNKHSINGVIHLAGYKSVNDSINNPQDYYNNNLVSTLDLLQVMEQFNCFNLIFSSSSTVYGNNNPPFKENDKIGDGITNPYGKTKYMIELILMDVCNSNSKWNITSLRYFNPVGNHNSGLLGDDPNKPNNLMPILVNVALQNNTTIQLENYQQLSVYGNNYPTIDGTPMRDYIHVEDLARGHILALQNIDKLHHYNSINLGLGKPISVLELVNTFSRVNKVEIPYLIKNRRDGDIPISYCIAENAQKKLDWYPEKTIEDMCQDSWKFAKMKYSMD